MQHENAVLPENVEEETSDWKHVSDRQNLWLAFVGHAIVRKCLQSQKTLRLLWFAGPELSQSFVGVSEACSTWDRVLPENLSTEDATEDLCLLNALNRKQDWTEVRST